MAARLSKNFSPNLANSGTFGPLMRLALPVLAEQLLTMLVGFTDWWLTGQYLQEASFQAAMGLMAYTLWLLPSLFAAPAIGARALVARSVGSGNLLDARRITHQALFIGMLIAIGVTFATAIGGGTYVAAMHLTGDAADHAARYLAILVPVIPAIMIEQIGIACLQGAGDTVSGFFARTIVNLINIAVSATLVIGIGSVDPLGWEGLAIGTACGHGVGGLIVLGLLLRGRAGLRLRCLSLRPRGRAIGRLLKVGLPGGTDTLVVVGCHLVYVTIINRLGTLAAAAHGLGITIESISYLPGSAFQIAAATLAGQHLGAASPQRAVHSIQIATLAGGVLLTSAGILFYFCPESLTAFFTGSADNPTAIITSSLLQIVALSMPFLAVLMIITGGLHGAGDTRWTLAITLTGFLLVRLPLACLLAWEQVPIPFLGIEMEGWNLGVQGAWYAMLADVILRSLLTATRFWHGGWTKIQV